MSVIDNDIGLPWMQSYPSELDNVSLDSKMDDIDNCSRKVCGMSPWRQRLYRFMSEKETSKSRWFYFFTVFIILISVATLSLSTVPEYSTGEPQRAIYIVETMCIAFFSVGILLFR
jgi:hypothetical protein